MSAVTARAGAQTAWKLERHKDSNIIELDHRSVGVNSAGSDRLQSSTGEQCACSTLDKGDCVSMTINQTSSSDHQR